MGVGDLTATSRAKWKLIYKLQKAEKSDSPDEIEKAIKEAKESKDFANDPIVTRRVKELEVYKTKVEQKIQVKKEKDEIRGYVEGWKENKERKKEIEDEKKELGKINNRIDGVGDALESGAESIGKISEHLSGHVSMDDVSKATKGISDTYDKAVKDAAKVITGEEATDFVEAWARERFHNELYDAAAAIKNGAADAISGIDGLMKVSDTFGGSWRDPKEDALKIQRGIAQIQESVTKISHVSNNVFKALKGRDSVILNAGQNIKNSVIVNTLSNVAGTAAVGIGSVEAFRTGDIRGGIAGIGTTVKEIGKVFSGIRKGQINKKEEEYKKDIEDTVNKIYPIDPPPPFNDNQIPDNSSTSPLFPKGDEQGDNKKLPPQEVLLGDEDYGADMINEVNVVIDGASCSDISCCVINGVKYKCSSYSLSQEMLNPMILSFVIEKFNKEETQQDVVFADATQTIGKTLEMNATTIKTSSQNAKVQKAFVFKGMIVDVSASRVTASAQSASITAASWDCLLQTAPHCRSFESLTLEEIVKKVLEPYGEIKSIVKPRMKKSIPYVVQYNQSDYAFLRMLAARFGEWMYSTGEKFIFGDMEELGSTAEMEYPGGSLLSYHLNQHTTPFAFNHLLTDHYKYGSSSDILKKPGLHVADGNVNEWTDRAYLASQKRYTNQRMEMLETGGFDNWKSEEGIDTIIDYSLKIEAEGMKTNLMSVQGSSKLAMLKVAQPMLICDSIQNKSGENQDVKQKVLRILGINHSFDYHQEYSNTFTAIPMGCKYPAYSNPSLHPIAPLQRARVTDNEDKQKFGRIRVQFPWQEIQDKEMKTPWLRLVTPYAGGEKGHLFVPEIGEEVIVGFEMDNAERPYIIGALYNGGEGKPDEKWAASNSEKGTKDNIKAIRTRGGHTILFNDRGDRGLLEIYDNKGNTYHITLSADDKKITICSAGDIEINADGSITMNARNDIKMNANKEITIQAAKVKVR